MLNYGKVPTGFDMLTAANVLGLSLLSLHCSARMMWVGPHVKSNKPEARDFSFWIKNSTDNVFITEHGIRCLANHEIGTHFVSFFIVSAFYSNKLVLIVIQHYSIQFLWINAQKCIKLTNIYISGIKCKKVDLQNFHYKIHI